jgi:hypothetical protein
VLVCHLTPRIRSLLVWKTVSDREAPGELQKEADVYMVIVDYGSAEPSRPSF